ncbi:Galactose-binding domain protein [Pseudocohnilembus persalinus]|uniref:Galactose-binding domain protein n=1 Tax=Pseudocohnilembus persalinus TaxID=266149 RepID=A0A0V0QRP9_PSEPJ|nr:Galactose-binding domain protein [Pseudocohnilembus persalinus]|eukprot:KRX05006.1 Galactose-binding domain protein [Pseudocohnilembus persalinus]
MEHVHSATCGCKNIAFSDLGVDLISNIDLSKIQCLNEAVPETGKKVFKNQENKLDPEPFVESDIDGELIFVVRFSNTIKLRQVCLIASNEEKAPVEMKIYKNKEQVDFGIVDQKPTEEINLIPNLDGTVMYSTNFSKFQDVNSLVLYVANKEIDDIRIQYIQLKGEITQAKKFILTDAVYEIRPTFKENDELDERKTNNEQFGH